MSCQSKQLLFILISLTTIALFSSSNIYADNITSQPPIKKKKFIVSSVKNETGEQQFNKLLVMDGLRNLVAQAFYETGKFIPLENDNDARNNIEEFKGKNCTLDTNTPNTINKLPDYMRVKPIIKKIDKTRTRSMIWGFSSATTTINIEIELEIKDVINKIEVVSGQGTGKMKSYGVLFQVRDEKISFDETGVGKALKAGVYNAVKQYISIISKNQDEKNVL